MLKESRLSKKIHFREKFLQIRNNLSSFRKEEAKANLMNAFSHFSGKILSFSPLKGEIDLSSFNQILALQKRLVLPKIVDENLQFFLVEDLHHQLKKSKFGFLEPVHCQQIDISEIQIALIPGVAFDPYKNRLGYGKGFYDRALSQSHSMTLIGIGFKEQLSIEKLPSDPWDIPVHELFLF